MRSSYISSYVVPKGYWFGSFSDLPKNKEIGFKRLKLNNHEWNEMKKWKKDVKFDHLKDLWIINHGGNCLKMYLPTWDFYFLSCSIWSYVEAFFLKKWVGFHTSKHKNEEIVKIYNRHIICSMITCNMPMIICTNYGDLAGNYWKAPKMPKKWLFRDTRSFLEFTLKHLEVHIHQIQLCSTSVGGVK